MLGYGSKAGRVNPVQRWRCDIAVRSRQPGRTGVVIFAGRGKSETPEAEVMSAYARDVLGLPGAEVRLEAASMSTWENILFALPMVETAEVIKIVSDPLHAARGRKYARKIRPDLAGRLAPADDYVFLERWWIKAGTAAYACLIAVRHSLVRPPP